LWHLDGGVVPRDAKVLELHPRFERFIDPQCSVLDKLLEAEARAALNVQVRLLMMTRKLVTTMVVNV